MSAGCLRSPAKGARPVFPSKSVFGQAEPLLDGSTRGPRPEKSSDGNAIYLRDPYPDTCPTEGFGGWMDKPQPCISRSATRISTPPDPLPASPPPPGRGGVYRPRDALRAGV